MLLALLLAALPDSPKTVVLLPESGALEVVIAAAEQGGTPPSLLAARKMAEQLRYEEAVVEYQRYLNEPDRPIAERANALLELGYTHAILGDQPNAERRALEAFELEPKIAVPSTAQAKLVDFVDRMRRLYLSRARLELVARGDGDSPYEVKVRVLDPEKKVARVLLRHALTSTGPYYSTEMRCTDDVCVGSIPPPKDVTSFTAWYFVEGLESSQVTAARVAGADSPLQLSIVDQKPWYTSPVVWGVSGAALVGIATVIFLLAPQPPK